MKFKKLNYIFLVFFSLSISIHAQQGVLNAKTPEEMRKAERSPSVLVDKPMQYAYVDQRLI